MNFTRLLTGNICGIVDNYGAAHSVFTGKRIDFHLEHFPLTHCRWRWNNRNSINSLGESKPTPEQVVIIQNHLTKVYGLKWWENGHHDIDDLMKKASEEKI